MQNPSWHEPYIAGYFQRIFATSLYQHRDEKEPLSNCVPASPSWEVKTCTEQGFKSPSLPNHHVLIIRFRLSGRHVRKIFLEMIVIYKALGALVKTVLLGSYCAEERSLSAALTPWTTCSAAVFGAGETSARPAWHLIISCEFCFGGSR